MSGKMNYAMQFDENPEIDDVIKALEEAKTSGYTRIEPHMVHGVEVSS